MKVWILLMFSFFLIHCGIHKSNTEVSNFFEDNSFSQKLDEQLFQAYLNSDFEEAERLIKEKKVNIDRPFSNGETLLYKAVVARNMIWIFYLVEWGADPETVLNLDSSKSKVSVLSYVDSLSDESQDKNLLKNLLSGQLEKISSEVLKSTLFEFDPLQEELDLDWVKLLLKNSGRLELDLDEFKKLFVRDLQKASNFDLILKVLFPYHKEYLEFWKEHIASDFASGPWRQGQCKFYQQNQTFTFDEFVGTCSPRAKRILERIQEAVERYLYVWNQIITYQNQEKL